MRIKIKQSFIALGSAVPVGAILSTSDDVAAEYINAGFAVPVEALTECERAVSPVKAKRRKAVTQA